MTARITSRPDPRLSATVLSRAPLLYSDGPDPSMDRPAHVRLQVPRGKTPGRIVIRKCKRITHREAQQLYIVINVFHRVTG